MARPAKATKVSTAKSAKSEKNLRTKAEDSVRGQSDRLLPPRYLTSSQKKVFKFIVSELKASGILSNLDIYVLALCAICVDRLQTIEQEVNDDPERLYDASLMSTRDKYAKDFYRCCNELCLSPQARAKIGSLTVAALKDKPNKVQAIIGADDE